MLLTLYYIISTWIQSWRLNWMKNVLTELLSGNTSVVLYKGRKLHEHESSANYESLSSFLRGVSSEYCSNKKNAHLQELWCFKLEKRGCSVSPIQIVDISDWIAIPQADTYFPIKFRSSARPFGPNKIFVLIEAAFSCYDNDNCDIICELENYGIAVAWTSSEYFAIVIQTDIDYLTKICCEFMCNELHFNSTMQIIRLQTVSVTGNPCELLKADRIPILIYSLEPNGNQQECSVDEGEVDKFDSFGTSDQKNFHVAMLRKVSAAAKQLMSSGKCFIDLDYPPVSVVRSGFVRPEATICTSQLVPKIQQLVENDSSRSNSVGDAEASDEPYIALRGNQASPFTGRSSSVLSSCSLNTAVSGSTLSFRRFGMDTVDDVNGDEVSSTKSMSMSLRTAETASLCGSKSLSNSVRHLSGGKRTGKPPNIIIFSESPFSVENIKTSLNNVLRKHRYTVYNLSLSEMLQSPWMEQTSLLIICGNVPPSLKPFLLKYLLICDGQLLCLCSDLLGVFLPTFKTAEVRPNEVVSFAYDQWPQIALLHHIFCYQSSPVSSKFSMDESPPGDGVSAHVVPQTVELVDANYQLHTLQVKVLAAEKTWQTPTLLLASQTSAEGTALFSQVHLEVDPPETENVKYEPRLRLSLLSNLLSKYMGVECDLEPNIIHYEAAYFLGRHERKLQFLQNIKVTNELVMKNITLQFCGRNTKYVEATARLLPVRLFECPHTFSTVEYFENLRTQHLGRLVIYSKIMTSSMEIVNGRTLEHGLVAISRMQTAGVGRSKNAWISPDGCAMFTIQLHVPLDSPLGHKLALLQHIVALSIVSAIRSQPGYEDLPLGLKWPNDIYAGGSVKIGGLVINSNISGGVAVCNAGCGVNLNNSQPTTCINDIIEERNIKGGRKVAKLSLEKYLAVVFSELERLLQNVSEHGTDEIFDLYYKYWLHNMAEVTITKHDKSCQNAVIVGLDEYGFLKVRGEYGDIFSVQPDGNTFDMLSGLIAPK